LNTVADANSPRAKDKAYLLHPNTNARVHEENGPRIIERGSGIYVYDDQGTEYIEALAGLWSVAVGFGEERLVQAATDQMRKLSYYHIFAHKSHVPAIDLADKLINLAPSKLQRVFFANSGSEAIDSIVKLIWYYNNANGRPKKKKIISRLRAFHGGTIASGSLTGLPVSHRDFDLPISNVLHTLCPDYYRDAYEGESEEEFSSRLAGQLEEMIVHEGPETIAAFIGEPLMGAGGVIIPPRTYWDKVQRVCRKYDILIIADEIISGFGRLGKMFGCEVYGIDPDIMVVSKQLTSSYLPLSAVLLSDEIYQCVADNTDKIGTLGHGFTTTGHPVATAVALENIRIIEDRGLVEHAASMAPVLQEGLRGLVDHPIVGDIRGIGLIAGVELVADKNSKQAFDPSGKLGWYFYERAHHHGLIIRCMGDTIGICPPLIIDQEQIDELVRRFALTLDDAYVWSKDNF